MGAGSVYVYRADGTLLSTLTGSSINAHVGRGGIVLLGGNRFVVVSPEWNNGTATQAGAVTFIDGSVGLSGVVSASNSLVGTSESDRVGYVTTLSNGNYVVASSTWDSGTTVDLGAVTWCDGASGCVGNVSSSNSLVGTSAGDQVGSSGVTALSNGNYVLASPYWDNGATADVGAVTWCDGANGCVGPVSASDSLVGTSARDVVGYPGVTALSNGNYVVASALWANGATANAGAATWCDGASACVGEVSASNSLVGTSANDNVGHHVTALSNGNYVVASFLWDNGAAVDAGAATWGNGASGSVGQVSVSNSLVGTRTYDFVGDPGVIALSNGNYVVASSGWDNGATANAGAASWGNGASGSVGSVSTSNSLVGKTAGDSVSSAGVTALSNGNYVVASPLWHNGATDFAGAATWGNGASGSAGPISPSNSLVGTSRYDEVGDAGLAALSNGNYAVASPHWNNGAMTSVGAVTWASGASGSVGAVSGSNSLVGTSAYDQVGDSVTASRNGDYVVASPHWNNGATADAGAVTLLSGNFRFVGTIAPWNSVIGGVARGGQRMSHDYDHGLQRLIVGRPAENIVTLFTMDQIFADGFQP
ncbi:MAG TPA: hypothetical protein VFG73_07620 [Rhodanobacteraceae bacterium]|nr:hypothetical protein [Rhodanobacteraceae bacterium]